jgi:hypothetical protein
MKGAKATGGAGAAVAQGGPVVGGILSDEHASDSRGGRIGNETVLVRFTS